MTNDIYIVGEETTIHVYEGVKCVGIYDKKDFEIPKFVSGFDRLDNQFNITMNKDGVYKRIIQNSDDKEAQFRKITNQMFELYLKKNIDYGGSFDESLDEDGLLVAKIRLKDKLNRFSQLINNDGLVEDESIHDTLIDLANYSIMTLMWLNEKDY